MCTLGTGRRKKLPSSVDLLDLLYSTVVVIIAAKLVWEQNVFIRQQIWLQTCRRRLERADLSDLVPKGMWTTMSFSCARQVFFSKVLSAYKIHFVQSLIAAMMSWVASESSPQQFQKSIFTLWWLLSFDRKLVPFVMSQGPWMHLPGWPQPPQPGSVCLFFVSLSST